MEETKLKERKLTKRKITMLVILGIVLLIGISYAIWQMVFVQSNPNLLSNSCFTTAFIEGEAIDLNNAFPMTNNESKTLSPFTFTIKNTCDLAAQYQINLEVLPTTPDSPLSNEYVRSSLNNSGGNILTDLSEVETTIPTATKSYMLKTGTLPSGASVTYDLRLWMDEDTPLIEGQNKVFKSKIVIITSPTVSPNILMAEVPGIESNFFVVDDFLRQNIESITFTNTNEVPLDALGSWDVSAAQDGSVMAWYKEGNMAGYWQLVDVWIGGKGGVTANPDSSYLFTYLERLKTIDFTYFDTSLVTDMSYMFMWACSDGSPLPLCSLDLSSWNTSSVTNMSYMFAWAGQYVTTFSLGDLSSWDVSKVTDMSYMFVSAGPYSADFNLEGLSNWDTSSVTNMENMFSLAGTYYGLATLDLRNWNISSVTNMDRMFGSIASLTELHLDYWAIPTATNNNMFEGSNNNLEIYVKNPSLGTWLSSSTNFPSGAQIILVP